jgi:hypothetical protein
MSFTLLANVSWSLIFENESFIMLIMISVLFCISDSTARTLPGYDRDLASGARKIDSDPIAKGERSFR